MKLMFFYEIFSILVVLNLMSRLGLAWQNKYFASRGYLAISLVFSC